jgi:putative transposase
MECFRDIKTPQRFDSAHASIHNLFNLACHLNQRATFEENRSTVLAAWRQLAI